MIDDKKILDWYMKGFHDELYGTSTIESKHEILNKAYGLGELDAILGDDLESVDAKSNNDILLQIKNETD